METVEVVELMKVEAIEVMVAMKAMAGGNKSGERKWYSNIGRSSYIILFFVMKKVGYAWKNVEYLL